MQQQNNEFQHAESQTWQNASTAKIAKCAVEDTYAVSAELMFLKLQMPNPPAQEQRWTSRTTKIATSEVEYEYMHTVSTNLILDV